MTRLTAATLLLVATTAAAQEKKPAASPAAEDAKTFYAIGASMAKTLEAFSPKPGELERVIAGLRDGTAGKAKVDLDAMQPRIEALAVRREKEQGTAYLEKMSKKKGAQKTENGAIVIVEKEGEGPHPASTDRVKVHYTGKLLNGRVFDSSVKRGQPSEFNLGAVIPCWTQGIQKLAVGGKATLVCPSSIAYGEAGRPPTIPRDAVLTFEVELLDILK
jgi:FKBP-type peptidyl-prolyl cis-trans isomerase